MQLPTEMEHYKSDIEDHEYQIKRYQRFNLKPNRENMGSVSKSRIPQLTQGIKPNAWSSAIAALRDHHHLLAQANDPKDDQLDCHPLIRVYFAHRLKSQAPDAWRAAHTKLYDYYKDLPSKEQPDTLEEMQPLFRAVAHGCAAGLHQQALDEVYWPRIKRSNQHYLTQRVLTYR